MRITKEARCAKNAREYIGNRPRLVEGKIYTLIFRQQPERSEKHTAIKKRMRISHLLQWGILWWFLCRYLLFSF